MTLKKLLQEYEDDLYRKIKAQDFLMDSLREPKFESILERFKPIM